MKCYDVTRKRKKKENGYSYKEANPFLTTYPLIPRVFIYLFIFIFYEKREWLEILRNVS